MLDIKLELGLTNESSQAKFLYFIMSSSLNIIYRLVSSLSQTRTFYFCCQAELEHSLLDKARLVYSLIFFLWATDIVAKFGIPRLVFHGTFFFL